MPRSEFDDLSPVRGEDHIIELNHGACTSGRVEYAFEVTGVADRQELYLDSEGPRGELCLPDVLGVARIGCVG